MKKSIFLFFAAILCAMSVNAKVIYLNAGGSSLWDQAGAVFTAKVSTTEEYPMTKVFGSYYEGTVPDDATKVTFMRNAPAGANWNKTSQLSIPTDGKNCYNITQWSSGNWSTYPPTFYIAGDFVTPSWSENAAANKMDYADGVYSKSYNNVAASAHQFKITNGTWTNAIGYDKNTCSGTNCTVEDGGGNIKFTPLAEGTVTITYTIADGKIHITCPEPPAAEFNITYPATQTNYTLVAGPAKAQTGAEVSFTATPAEGYVLNVTYNGNAITGNNNVYTFMMPAADVTIAITAVAATTLYYVDNSKWGNANAYMWNDHGNNGWPGAAMALVGTVGDDAYSYYSISFAQGAYTSIIFNNGNGSQTADLTIKTETPYFYDGAWYTWDVLLAKLAAPVVDVYTVVGSENLFVSAWAPSAEANDMEKQDDGSYKKVYSNVELTSDVIWKIAKNDDWWTGPSFNNQDNALAIAKSGIYNVTFVLSADLKTATAEAELLEETNTVADCYISGNAALTGGAGWAGNEFKMEYDDATETYSYTLTGLATDKAYELKVVLGGSWLGYDKLQTVLAGVENKDGNIAFTLATVGDVVVTYNKDNGINLSGNFYVAQDYYTVVGTEVLFGTPWDITSEANKMEKQPDGSYKLVKENVTLAAIEYEWKITKNGTDWMDDNKTVNPVGNNKIKISTAGRYNVTFTLAADIKSAKAEIELIEAAVVIPDCFISGNKNLTGKETEWLGNEFTMVYDEANETWSYTLAGLQPEKEYALKVVCGGTWYSYANLTSIPAGVTKGNDDAIAFKMAEAGDVTVTYNVGNGITISGNFYVAPTYDYYIAGTLAGAWSATQQGMIKDGDVYKHTFSELAAGTYEFKITDGQWNTEEDKTHEYTTLGAAYEEVSYNEGNIKIVTEEAINLTVIFDGSKITFEGLTEIVATELVYKVTVPAGTPNCYIVFGDAWDAENAPAMTKVDDTHYTYTRTGLKSDQYKYLYGQSWDFVEVRADNRTWAEEDVVENWNNPYTEVRTALTAGNYYTICMNKEMKEIQGATLWSFCGKDANFAYLVQEEAPYTAGKAYIMYAGAETVSAILTGEPALAPVANGAIYGTFADMDQAALDAAGDNIYLVIGNQLRRVDGQTGNSLPANRAYVDIDKIEITGGAPAGIPANRVRSMPMQPQVATGMENVDASAQPVKTIINGQLYILRGEKMYDAQGKLVK